MSIPSFGPCDVAAACATHGRAALAGLARLADELTGIVLAPDRSAMIEARLSRRLRALGLLDLDAYLEHLVTEHGQAEQTAFISAITTNDSAFFREPHHFEILRHRVLPPLIARARAGGRVRIWSAGTALGQEAYSLAMLALDMMPDAERHDLRILATDIDDRALAAAREALFPVTATASLPNGYAARFLDRKGDMVAPCQSVRALVRFRRLNIHGDWPMRQPFDVIFCRNVAIYFSAEARARLWGRLASALHSGGYLFIGHSERIDPSLALPLAAAGPTCSQRIDMPAGPDHEERP